MDSDTVDPGGDGELMDNAFVFAKKRTPCARRPVTVTLVSQPRALARLPIATLSSGYKDVSSESKQTLMTTVAQQCVSTAIEADRSSRRSHMSGVVTTSCASKFNHGAKTLSFIGMDWSDEHVLHR